MKSKITCTCFYREDDHCFLNRPGPQDTCPDYEAPPVILPAPLDPEMRKLFEKVDHKEGIVID